MADYNRWKNNIPADIFDEIEADMIEHNYVPDEDSAMMSASQPDTTPPIPPHLWGPPLISSTPGNVHTR